MKEECAMMPCNGCPQMLVEVATLMSLFALTIVAKLLPLILG